jgi:trimethylamine---corrinoid protein Co-methyltransferase
MSCAAWRCAPQTASVYEDTLALDVIRQVNFRGHYLAEAHTVSHYRKEHYIPALLPREPYDAWVKAGSRSALDHAHERVQAILAKHQPRVLDPALEEELEAFRKQVAGRSLEAFYSGEMAEYQDWDNL